jgi:excisionase family DNA binding protein
MGKDEPHIETIELSGFALTTGEAAGILGVSDKRIRQFITSGRIKARKTGRDWLVDVDDFERFRAVDRPQGRPPKKPE